MRFLIVCILSINILLACTGDCIKCHPVLKTSIEKEHHKILKTCISCHQKGDARMNECGADCFACHNKQKLIKSNRFEHQQMASCIQCHATQKDMLEIIDRSSNLLDILNQK